MSKFPLKIEKEEEVTLNLLRELLMVYTRNLVKSEGDFIDAEFQLDGEIDLTLHNGKIAKGSKVSLDFKKKRVFVKVAGE